MPHVLDHAEFGRLFVEHARVLWVVAAAFVPKVMVEDVLQDAAAVALSRLPDFDATTSFRAWMTQIVRFTAANLQRRARRDARAESIETDDVPGSVSAALDLTIARNGVLHPQQTDFDDHVLLALLHGSSLHFDAVGRHGLAGEDETAGLLLGFERILDSHGHRALEERDLARPAGAGAAGEIDGDADVLRGFQDGRPQR